MAKKNGYLLIGKPYIRSHYYESRSVPPYTCIRSDSINSVSFEQKERIVEAGERHIVDKHIPGIKAGTKIYISTIYLAGHVLEKISTDKSIIEEAKNDYRQIIKLINGENKIVNLSDFDPKPSTDDDDEDETED